MIRQAGTKDASRIAEILVFTKHVNYREIFHKDLISFGVMQVYPLAKDCIDHPEKLEHIYVYDDAFVKGMIHIEGKEIRELFVDTFFENQGIGSARIKFAIREKHCSQVWVLEKNERGRQFYERQRFHPTGEKKPEEGTAEWTLQMVR